MADAMSGGINKSEIHRADWIFRQLGTEFEGTTVIVRVQQGQLVSSSFGCDN